MVMDHSFKDVLDALPVNSVITLPKTKENAYKIEFGRDDCQDTVYGGGHEPPMPFANSEVCNVSISHWRRLTAVTEGCKAVYEVTFDVTNRNFTFKAGDTISILPRNDTLEVNNVITHLELTSQADLPYTLSVDSSPKGCRISPHIPIKSTVRHVLMHCVDLRSILKKLFLLALSRHTKDENERRILEYLCSKEGSTAYTTHILNRNLCLLDIFSIFRSCKPPIEILLAYLPRLLPRPYSVVNTGLKDSNRIKICFSVMNLGKNRKGLTTGWLENIILNEEFDLERSIKSLSINNECDGGKIPIYIRKNLSGFYLPNNLETPLILIGPGTGVSPFVGFLQEIELAKENNPNNTFGEVRLYFGCRNPKLDFIYEEELNGFFKRGVLSKIIVACSRTEDYEFKYIQDALMADGENVTRLIRNGASVFTCGDLKTMAVQIKETLVKCLVKYDSLIEEDAVKFIVDMQKGKRYFVDAWS